MITRSYDKVNIFSASYVKFLPKQISRFHDYTRNFHIFTNVWCCSQTCPREKNKNAVDFTQKTLLSCYLGVKIELPNKYKEAEQ